MIVAIDGPSGAGKSTVSQLVACTLGFNCLDTGAMYRSVAWMAQHEGADLYDDAACGRVARMFDIEFSHTRGDPKPTGVRIGGYDVTALIRTAEIDKAVTPVSAAPSVRLALVEQQRRIGKSGNFVVEGRDIGTVVFPEAELKIFLTASPEERAHRRLRQNIGRGIESCTFEDVLADIIRRDEADSSRDCAPLKPASDAILLDSTRFAIEQVAEKICALALERMSA